MTATQFVSHGGEGLWAYDVALGVFLKHLIDATEAQEPLPEWLGTAVQDWRRTACISDYGLNFDAGWSSEQIATVVALVERACAALGARESIPSIEVESWRILGDVRMSARGAASIPTANVSALGRAIRSLLTGTLPASPSGTAWLYGTQEAPSTIGMRR